MTICGLDDDTPGHTVPYQESVSVGPDAAGGETLEGAWFLVFFLLTTRVAVGAGWRWLRLFTVIVGWGLRGAMTVVRLLRVSADIIGRGPGRGALFGWGDKGGG